MGNCVSGAQVSVDAASAAVNKEIERRLKQDMESGRKVIKLLLLGAGETGKSTILKQLKLIHNIGFSIEERKTFKSAIVLNMITCAKSLVKAMQQLEIPFGVEHTSSSSAVASIGDVRISTASSPVLPKQAYTMPLYAQELDSCDISFCFSEENAVPTNIYDAITRLWRDPGVQHCFSRSNEYQLLDSCGYFMENVERICSSTYDPTDQDILSARILTTKVSEINFVVDGNPFKVIDLGGQRSERKKWVPFFDDVKAILFLVAISSYDQVCFEDNSTNRMVESMDIIWEYLQPQNIPEDLNASIHEQD